MISIDEFIARSGSSVSPDEVRSRSRKTQVAIAREAYWYYLRVRHGLGPRRISRLDGRCKETVFSGLKTIQNLLETNHPLVSPYQHILCN
ncbi:MAG: hypothetical protein LBK22_06055 [Tannerella sp.]|nr:hypothetical protein [Tannerella sp.]